LGGLRRLRFARKAAASFSGEDLAIKALSPVPKIPDPETGICGFPSWNPYVIAAHPSPISPPSGREIPD
jgi:hypothetical protein